MILEWHFLVTSTNSKQYCVSQNKRLCNRFNQDTNEHQRKQSITISAYQKISIRLVMIHNYMYAVMDRLHDPSKSSGFHFNSFTSDLALHFRNYY